MSTTHRRRIDDASTTHRRRFADVSVICFRICRRKQKSHEMASHHTWIPLQIIMDGLFMPETCYFMPKTMLFCSLVFMPSIRGMSFKTLPSRKKRKKNKVFPPTPHFPSKLILYPARRNSLHRLHPESRPSIPSAHIVNASRSYTGLHPSSVVAISAAFSIACSSVA